MLTFCFDPLTGYILVLVAGIGGVVHLYALRHNHGLTKERHIVLWISTVVTLVFVHTDHLLVAYACWEVLSSLSFLLIHHHIRGGKVFRDGLLVWTLNQLGSGLLLVGVVQMAQRAHTFSIEALSRQWLPSVTSYQSDAVMLMLLGVCIKSAQFPCSVWLRRAAGAPTPVSALLHTVSLLGCGTYLLIRLYPVLNDLHCSVLIGIGGLTTFTSSLAALLHTECKARLAYSTTAHIGMALTGIGLGRPDVGLHYFAQHAFCKACLFFCNAHASDTPSARLLPMHWMASYVLLGLPVFVVSQPKHALLEAAVAWAGTLAFWAWLLPLTLVSSTFMTAMYLGQMGRCPQHTSFERSTPVRSICQESTDTVLQGSAATLLAGGLFVTLWGRPQKWFAHMSLETLCPTTHVICSFVLYSILVGLFVKSATGCRFWNRLELQVPGAFRKAYSYAAMCASKVYPVLPRVTGLIVKGEVWVQSYLPLSVRWLTVRWVHGANYAEQRLGQLSRRTLKNTKSFIETLQRLTQRGDFALALRWTVLTGSIVAWSVVYL